MHKVRRTIALSFTFIIALLLFAVILTLPQRLAFRGGESYTFFIGDSSKNCKVVSCAGAEADYTRLTLSGVCGESATFKAIDLEEFLREVDGEIIFSEELDDSVNYYCTARLPYSVTLYGRQINLHICVKADGVTVGTPIIFGGY